MCTRLLVLGSHQHLQMAVIAIRELNLLVEKIERTEVQKKGKLEMNLREASPL